MTETVQVVLRITWDQGVSLPEFVGPFDTDAQAVEWADLNVPNGTAEVVGLAYPYMRPRVVR